MGGGGVCRLDQGCGDLGEAGQGRRASCPGRLRRPGRSAGAGAGPGPSSRRLGKNTTRLPAPNGIRRVALCAGLTGAADYRCAKATHPVGAVVICRYSLGGRLDTGQVTDEATPPPVATQMPGRPDRYRTKRPRQLRQTGPPAVNPEGARRPRAERKKGQGMSAREPAGIAFTSSVEHALSRRARPRRGERLGGVHGRLAPARPVHQARPLPWHGHRPSTSVWRATINRDHVALYSSIHRLPRWTAKGAGCGPCWHGQVLDHDGRPGLRQFRGALRQAVR